MTDLAVAVILILALRGAGAIGGDVARFRRWFREWSRWSA